MHGGGAKIRHKSVVAKHVSRAELAKLTGKEREEALEAKRKHLAERRESLTAADDWEDKHGHTDAPPRLGKGGKHSEEDTR